MNTEKLEKFITQLLDNMLWSGATSARIENYMELIKKDVKRLKKPFRPGWNEMYKKRIAKNYTEMCELIRSKKDNIRNIPEIETNEPEEEKIYIPFNYITASLYLTKKEAEIGFHSGDCTTDIQNLSELPEIKEQLLKISPEELKKELQEEGAWSDEELNNHQENLQRILWISCANVIDGSY